MILLVGKMRKFQGGWETLAVHQRVGPGIPVGDFALTSEYNF
jgi:hypothetical protein